MPFFLLKGLSFLPFGGFLKNPKILIGLILIAALAFAYFKWKDSIKEAAYNAIYSEQVEQHLENQRKQMEATQKIIAEGSRAVNEAHRRREALIRDVETARAKTRNVDPEKNGPVAPVLSEALDFIRRSEMARNPSKETIREKAKGLVDDAVEATKGAVSSGNAAIDAWKARSNK